jgi:hypothetical protein
MYPRARQSPLEGGVYPRAGRNPLEGGVYPRARRSLLEGTFKWAALVGRGGHRGVGRAPCALKKDALIFGFFTGFKRGFPICLRGPPGLSPTVAPEHLRVRRPGSRRCWSLLIGRASPWFANAFRGAASVDPRV